MGKLLAILRELFSRKGEPSRLDRIVEEVVERCVIEDNVIVSPDADSVLAADDLEAEIDREIETALTWHGAPKGWN